MYESLMKTGGHRVDYFHENRRGTPQSYALYIRGDLPGNAPYSKIAKHHLLSSLMAVEATLGLGSLVGIYMDISSSVAPATDAFFQMAEDLKKDYFKRVVVCSMQDLDKRPTKTSSLEYLRKINPDFELIVLQEHNETCNEIPGLPLMAAA